MVIVILGWLFGAAPAGSIPALKDVAAALLFLLRKVGVEVAIAVHACPLAGLSLAAFTLSAIGVWQAVWVLRCSAGGDTLNCMAEPDGGCGCN